MTTISSHNIARNGSLCDRKDPNIYPVTINGITSDCAYDATAIYSATNVPLRYSPFWILYCTARY